MCEFHGGKIRSFLSFIYKKRKFVYLFTGWLSYHLKTFFGLLELRQVIEIFIMLGREIYFIANLNTHKEKVIFLI